MTALLLFTASPLAAQLSHAYDPNYVDFSAKMDTLRHGQTVNFNMGDLNGDGYDDLALGSDIESRSYYQYGGPSLFDSMVLGAPFALPIIRGDFNGDGIPDMISHGFTLSAGPLFFKGKKEYPYFDTASGFLTDRYHKIYSENPSVLGSVDANKDGFSDIFAFDGGSGILALFAYYGGSHFRNMMIDPSDSMLILPEVAWSSGTIGTYGSSAKPMIFIAGSATSPDTPHTVTYKIGAIRHLNDLAHDTIVYLSQTTESVHWYHPGTDSMIAATGLYTMDITGDGIPDLLVTDGVYIYIFKGSDSLGYYPLTKDRAYYRIPHPELLEGPSSDWSYIDSWAVRMFNCGDLTGSGVPVLGVIGQSSTGRNAVFFYCGGKALDSLFDGLIKLDGGGQFDDPDTLHSIDNSGRSAVLISDNFDTWGGGDMLVYRGADKMPHRTNPNLVVDQTVAVSEFKLSAYPAIANHFVKVQTESPGVATGKLTIFNLLGESVSARSVLIDPGDNTEYFNTSQWPSGTYIAELSTDGKVSTTRFIVRH